MGLSEVIAIPKLSSGVQTSVAAAASDTAILATNRDRRGFAVFNDSTSLLYLLVASGAASSTSHTVQVLGGGYYENLAGYCGPVRGYWVSATGSARVTEWT